MKNLKLIISILMILTLLFSVSAVSVSAAESTLNTAAMVSFTVNCDKPHYEFTVYKVANLKEESPSSDNKYQVVYRSSIDTISDSVLNGNSEDLLAALDLVEAPTGKIGTYQVDTDGNSKTFSGLRQGIYYVRATNYPAGVKSVTNSVFALPYYTADEGWVYTIDSIPLADKVDESEPEIVKTITNSTKNNVNYTDVSLGDTVNFEIQTDTVGSEEFKLNSYLISDTMSKGLTLNQSSFTVKLLDESGAAFKTLTVQTDYAVAVTASDGADTTFTVSLMPTYLAKEDFYTAKKVSFTYSAVLNRYAVIGKVGNPNEAEYLQYSNKNGVISKIDGNKVYVYTYALQVNKFDEKGSPLAGADFALYKTVADATDDKNVIATGTSGDDGIVKFYNTKGEEMKLQSGQFFIRETKTPTGYNRYTEIIGIGDNPVKIKATYGDTLVNNTYVTSAPENGIATVSVKNTRTLLPQTGGLGEGVLYVVALLLTALAAAAYFISRKQKSM